MSQFILAVEVRNRLTQAGVAEADLVRTIAAACLRGSVRATGIGTAFRGDVENWRRDRGSIGDLLWRALERVDPQFDLERPEARDRFEITVSWSRGYFSWCHFPEEQEPIGETFSDVLFERASFEAWLDWFVTRQAALNKLTDHETLDWIREWLSVRTAGRMPTSQACAYKAYRAQFGNRSIKKAAFEALFRNETGKRGRGRPRAA